MTLLTPGAADIMPLTNRVPLVLMARWRRFLAKAKPIEASRSRAEHHCDRDSQSRWILLEELHRDGLGQGYLIYQLSFLHADTCWRYRYDLRQNDRFDVSESSDLACHSRTRHLQSCLLARLHALCCTYQVYCFSQRYTCKL